MNGRIHPSDRLLECAVLYLSPPPSPAVLTAFYFNQKKMEREGGKARVVVFIPSAVLWLLWRLSEGGGDEWWVVFAAEAADHP